MEAQYWTFILENVSSANEEIITLFLFENGAGGIQENLEFLQKDKKYLPEIVQRETTSLIAYFENCPRESLVQDLMARFPEVRCSWQENTSRDWLKEWKEQWKPFCLSDDIWVVPGWYRQNFSTEDKQAIYIEPGMAFGTGTHDTTQVASQLLVDLLKTENIKAALDVGTGSGILSLLMRLKGVSTIYAYDNDPEALRVFNENMEKNQSQGHWIKDWSEELVGKVPLTVANIIDGVLLDLKADFQKVESQFYIFTGVLLEREEEFLKEMTQGWDLVLRRRLQSGEWVGFCFENGKK